MEQRKLGDVINREGLGVIIHNVWLMPKENAIMKQLSGRWKMWNTLNWPESLMCQWRWEPLWFRRFPPPLPSYFHSIPAALPCLVLFCPLPSRREEQESINRLVSVADVTMLYGPVILQGLVWRECRTKDRHAGRIFPMTAHCRGGTLLGSIICKRLLYLWGRNAKPTAKCSLNQSHGSIKLGSSCMAL